MKNNEISKELEENKNNTICYMLIGLPGSGKSTLTKDLLILNPELKILSSDYYIEKNAKEKSITYQESYKELGDIPFKSLNVRVQNLIKNKKSFIWDQTNLQPSARMKKIRMLKQNKYNVVGIAIEIPEEELFSRLFKRQNLEGKEIPKKILEEMMSNYIRPDITEGFLNVYLVDQFKNILNIAPNKNNSFKKKF